MSALLLLIGLIVIIIGILIYQKMTLVTQKSEGFTGATAETQLSFCPVNTTAYLNLNGDTECCDGSVTMNECMGTPICAISTNSSLPSCSDVQASYFRTMGADKCPSGMSYYEPLSGNPGCASQLNGNKNAPVNDTVPQCIIYSDMNANYSNQNSCYNKKNLQTISTDATALFKSNGVTTSFQGATLVPQVIGPVTLQMVQVSYVPKTTSPAKTCYYASDLSKMIGIQQANGILTADDASARMSAINSGIFNGECGAMAAVYNTKTLAEKQLRTF